MRRKRAFFGFSAIKASPNSIPPSKVQKRGNYLSFRKNTRKHMKSVKPKTKTFHM
jgi:hypothetical protein